MATTEGKTRGSGSNFPRLQESCACVAADGDEDSDEELLECPQSLSITSFCVTRKLDLSFSVKSVSVCQFVYYDYGHTALQHMFGA